MKHNNFIKCILFKIILKHHIINKGSLGCFENIPYSKSYIYVKVLMEKNIKRNHSKISKSFFMNL